MQSDHPTDSANYTGRFLVANGMMADSNFHRSVILICSHDPDGAFGLILNRPSSVSLDSIFPDVASESARGDTIYVGGPVQPSVVLALHQRNDLIPESHEVFSGLYTGGNMETIQSMLTSGELAEQDIRFFLGYAGWGAGQLEEEMNEDSWFITEADVHTVFAEDPDESWARVLNSMGAPYSLFARMPDDPRMN